MRVSSLCQGASGISPETAQVLIDILNADIILQVPLRGSISASGDLSPLLYIAGVMTGSPALKAYKDGQQISANEALAQADIKPAQFGAKEALAVVNGTAVSATVGSLAMHETLQLAAISQILTAMSVEAMSGTAESFDSFIANVRPHVGQTDSANRSEVFFGEYEAVLQRVLQCRHACPGSLCAPNFDAMDRSCTGRPSSIIRPAFY